MYTKPLLAALVAAPVAVSAYGSAIVHNQCSSNVYMWSVSSDGTGSMQTIPAGGSYSEQYFKPSNGGVSIKLAKSPFGAFDSSAITQFEYTLDGMIWYDISNINGYPFMDGGVKLVPGEASCPTKICPPGVKYCTDAYNTPDENAATGACSAESNTSFYLCGAEPEAPAAAAAPVAEAVVKPAPKPAPAPAPKPEEKPAPAPAPAPAPKPEEKPAPAPKPEEKPAPAPAPAPAVTSAPAVAPSPVAAVDAGVFTTFVTQVVTVAARDAAPEPTAVPLKRDDSHANMHKRAAHRHHFHRHGDVN